MGPERRSGDFIPIKLSDFVHRYIKSNPGSVRADVTKRLEAALKAYKSGTRCHCGAPIWVVGSAETGYMCFKCITGETTPSGDYEIAEACGKRLLFTDRMVGRRGFLPEPDPALMERYASESASPRAASGGSSNREITCDDVPF